MTKLTFNLFFIIILVFSVTLMVQDVQAKKCQKLFRTRICYPELCREMCQGRAGHPGSVAKCDFTLCVCQWDC
ncbi:hypothetical protein Peur_041581 [Populus x canadensis]